MRRLLQKWFKQPLIRLADEYSSRPDAVRVHGALTALYNSLITNNGKRGIIIPFDAEKDKFVILSDQHKGARNHADDFILSEKNYLAALDYYGQQQYHYINLGDSEELWENGILAVKKHNKATFEKEKLFLKSNAFIKIFGNHDLYWDNDPLAGIMLEQIYGVPVKIYEGVILQTKVNNKPLSIYLTHGHQGDLQSDGNWFSKWFVANVWGPLQAYLEINPNTPATNDHLKTQHNQIMYEWSSRQNNLLLITGHTHQPVFRSLTHLERLYIDLEKAEQQGDTAVAQSLRAQINKHVLKGDAKFSFPGYRPSYFNTGCCCYDDGDITGIEITEGCMRLIKWEYDKAGQPERIVLDESKLEEILIGLAEIRQ
ncbi:metallophosphoesterase [Mucilaginibacter sp. PAMB04168]|uniref:metallophosphoesterase n=1 Tax=Mucilaginibacter sp. PAMB04168 TaxID=3138567 RepID=UPI0031F709BF